MGVDSGTVTVTALTHRGAVRQVNEDALVMGALTVAGGSMNAPARCLLPVQEPLVLAVADGLGGHAAGEIASEHAVHRMAESGFQLVGPEPMRTLLQHIDEEIREHSVQNEEFSGMGTTVAGLLLTEEGIYWFNVGDSRTYRIRNSHLEQLSDDDSPPTVPGEDGRPTSTNFITQSLGGSSSTQMQPHVGQDHESGAEGWLMCSDGLSDLVTDDEMNQILAGADSDEAVVRDLWQAAMKASGRDNISIVLVRPY